mmetsp:Transcript_86/g.230  ORF Transcript_86/g.230 Transcript_86/m.230 type:complete len:464 (+) Transcript_86:63-1454(+)
MWEQSSQHSRLPQPGKQRTAVIGQKLRTESTEKTRFNSAGKGSVAGNPGRTRLQRPASLAAAAAAPWRKAVAEPAVHGVPAVKADGMQHLEGTEGEVEVKTELHTQGDLEALQQKLAEAEARRQNLEQQVALEQAAQTQLQREKQILEQDLHGQTLQVEQLQSQLQPLLQLQEELESVHLHPGNRLFTVPTDIDARSAYRLGWEAAIEVARQVAQEEAERGMALSQQAEEMQSRSLEEQQLSGWVLGGAAGPVHSTPTTASQTHIRKVLQTLDVPSPSDDDMDPRHDGTAADPPAPKRQKKTLEDWITDQSEFEGLPQLPQGWIRIRAQSNNKSMLYFNTLDGSYQLKPPEAAPQEVAAEPSSIDTPQESRPTSAVKPSAKPVQHSMLETKQESLLLDKEVTLTTSESLEDTFNATGHDEAAAEQDPPSLPPGWALCYSRSSGKPYYYHAGLKKSQYARPTSS